MVQKITKEAMLTLIKNATLVNEGTERIASVLIEDDLIVRIIEKGQEAGIEAEKVIDAQGMLLMPGVIDDHVHMRDPGLTQKADMDTETRAAAAGGVTSVMDMPNVVPQTTTLEQWEQKMNYAAQHCHVNYAMYLGATNDNIKEVEQMDTHRIPALKLFMGSSTGGMLVDKENLLRDIFQKCPTTARTQSVSTNAWPRPNSNKARTQRCHGIHGYATKRLVTARRHLPYDWPRRREHACTSHTSQQPESLSFYPRLTARNPWNTRRSQQRYVPSTYTLTNRITNDWVASSNATLPSREQSTRKPCAKL